MATVPDGYIFHNGLWYARDGTGPYYINSVGTAVLIGGNAVADLTEAALSAIPAAASNLNTIYNITDRRGGTLVKSNGTSWVEVAPALNDVDGIPATTAAAAILAGGSLYDLAYLTHASWNQPVRGIFDGTRWQPDTGRQLLYNSRATVSGSTAATSTAPLPTVTIPGGLLGLNGGLDFEMGGQSVTTPATVTPSITFDGYDLAGGNSGANRGVWLGRRVRNLNSASAQIVMGNAGATGAFAFSDTDRRTTTKNTANDINCIATCVWTFGATGIGTIHEYKVWWIAG